MGRRGEVIMLLRSLLRTARGFSDYNVREYAKRRTLDAFRHNARLSEIDEALALGHSQLAIAKRQALLYSLYAPNLKSVMELSPTTK